MDGVVPEGHWKAALATRFDRTIYVFSVQTTQAADATIEHKRQMFLKKELAWVRQGPRAQRSKQKDRFERYYDRAAQEGPAVEEDVELCIPPPPPLGNWPSMMATSLCS